MKKNFYNKAIDIFHSFESMVSIILSVIIGLIIVVSLIRIGVDLYDLFIVDLDTPSDISFKNYQKLFGKVITMLISLEFLSSILKVLKLHQIRTLVLDVVLITALAIARKLIVLDYDSYSWEKVMTLGLLLISLGVFYFLVQNKRSAKVSGTSELTDHET